MIVSTFQIQGRSFMVTDKGIIYEIITSGNDSPYGWSFQEVTRIF